MTKIYFGNADAHVRGVLDQYDTLTDSGESTTEGPDGALSDSEIEKAGGSYELERLLLGYGFHVVPKGDSSDEYNLVPIVAQNCEPKPQVEMAESSTSRTPNGRVYPGVIISVSGGEFEMGTVCDGRHGYDGTHDTDEHTSDGKTVKVRISDFRMAKTEVTIGQYVHYLMESRGISDGEARNMLPNDWAGNNKKGDNFPVVALTFEEKMEFAKYYGGTLPKAAQIEYASKGKSHKDVYGTPIDKAIVASNGATTTAEVCGPNDERANDLGFCDLAGNAWEATLDGYNEGFYSRMPGTDPYNPLSNNDPQEEFRGGSFYDVARSARAAYRIDDFPDNRYGYDGFRVAWSQDS